jgi:hypothetical protein
LVVDKGAFRGLRVEKQHAAIHQHELAMNARNGRMFDGKIIIRMPADTIGAQLEINQPGIQPIRLNR